MKALLACVLAVGIASGSLQAALTLKTVTVGDSGNKPDENGLGKVDYVFDITEKQITNDIFVRFLNAVDAYGTNVRNLYNQRMSSGPNGGVLFDPAAEPGEKYRVREGMEEAPIYYVNWVDAARFCNWLANGSKIGSSTEVGSYNLIRSRGQITPRTRKAGFWIPDADEIYKAANYLPNGLWKSVTGLLDVERTKEGKVPNPAIQLQTIGNKIMDIVDVEIPAAVQQLVSAVYAPTQASEPTPVFEAISDPQTESNQRSFYVATIPQEEFREEPYSDGLPLARGISFGNGSGGSSDNGDTDDAGGNSAGPLPVPGEVAIYLPPPPTS